MKVGRICQRTVAVAAPADTLVDAARRMRNLHVGDLVVVVEREGRRFAAGILTDRDIVVRVIAAGATDLPALLVADVMTGDVITISEHDDIFRALQRMRQHGVRRLPVTASDGSLMGIVTLDDVIEVLSSTLRVATNVVVRQQGIERSVRRRDDRGRAGRPAVASPA